MNKMLRRWQRTRRCHAKYGTACPHLEPHSRSAKRAAEEARRQLAAGRRQTSPA